MTFCQPVILHAMLTKAPSVKGSTVSHSESVASWIKLRAMLHYVLYEKDSIGLIQAMLDPLCGDAYLSLEGHLAGVIEILASITNMPVPGLRKQIVEPAHDHAVIPLEWRTLSTIRDELLPSCGVGRNVIHVEIAKDGRWQFGGYDLDHWGPGMHALFAAGEAIEEPFLKQLVSRRLLRGYEIA